MFVKSIANRTKTYFDVVYECEFCGTQYIIDFCNTSRDSIRKTVDLFRCEHCGQKANNNPTNDDSKAYEYVDEDINLLAEALKEYVGKKITLFCCRYIYSGKVLSIDDFSIKLDGPIMIFETGNLQDPEWKKVETFPPDTDINITLASIESFGNFVKRGHRNEHEKDTDEN